MGENKMETPEKDTTQVECKEPDEDGGGIRRQLRDRDLLRKRKAEAEKKAIYQPPSKRKRQERTGGSGRRGRPRKTETGVLSQPPQEGAPQDSREEEEPLQGSALLQAEVELTPDSAKNQEPVTTDADKPKEPITAVLSEVAEEHLADNSKQDGEGLPALAAPATLSSPLVSLLSPPALPAIEPLVIPVPEQAPQPESNSSSSPQPESQGRLSEEEVSIEDLGPEEEEDVALPKRELVTEQGTTEEPGLGDDVTDSMQAFSIPSIVSPPQPSYCPGPSL